MTEARTNKIRRVVELDRSTDDRLIRVARNMGLSEKQTASELLADALDGYSIADAAIKVVRFG